MFRRGFLSVALGLAASCAVAQTAPSPADVGVSKGSPDIFKLKGHDNAWTPFGSVDPSTHIFIPGTNGNIAPNDCVKWGPGLTSAGAACNSVTGGATPANQLTIYTNHAGLLANVTTPTEAWTIQQQGFYAPGDGGQATYQWNFNSYCGIGTSGAPGLADGVVCVLPAGQVASTAGRYLLQTSAGLDVRQIGMQPGGSAFDNLPYVATLMTALNPPGNGVGGMDVFFPAVPGQRYSDYWFSKSFHISRHMHVKCQGVPNGGGDTSVRFVFADGVHGLIFDNNATALDGQISGGGVTGCSFLNTSYWSGIWDVGSASVTGVAPFYGWPLPEQAWQWGPGDGVIMYRDYEPPNGAPAIAGGAYITAANASAHTLTLSSSTLPTVAEAAHGPMWRLPAALKFTVNTTAGDYNVSVTGGPSLLMPGDYVWSDAFPFGAVVKDTSGTAGAQAITIGVYHLNGPNYVNATKTETGGQLWIVPSGLKDFVALDLRNNYFATFPFGLEMECSSWGTPGAGCNGSMAQQNQFIDSIIGRLAVGDNTGASTSVANIYSYNKLADIAELGSVGSVYLGDNSNSAEASTAIFGVVGLCGSENFTSYIGMYAASNTATTGYCLQGFNGESGGAAPGGANIWFAPLSASPPGSPQISNGYLGGPWYFAGPTGNVCFNNPSYLIVIGGTCDGTYDWTWELSGAELRLSWYNGVGGSIGWITNGALGGYTGYTFGNLGFYDFHQGFLLYDTESNSYTPGPERLVDEGPSIPVLTQHKQGDIHFNQSAALGAPAGWVNTADGANFQPFGTISAFSGTKTAGSCVFTIVNGVITNVTGC